MGGSNIYTLLDTKSRQSHSETTIGSPTVRRGQSRSETGVVSLRDAKEDSVKEDSVKEDRKKKGTNSVGALQMNRKDRKLIHPEKDLIAWMKDTARDYGRKGWKLSGHYSNTNKNYQGPTPSMEEKLYEREKQKNGAEIVRDPACGFWRIRKQTGFDIRLRSS